MYIDNKYCIKTCELGKRKSEEFLALNNSAYDAAMDMCAFVDKCRITCPHKNKHTAKED